MHVPFRPQSHCAAKRSIFCNVKHMMDDVTEYKVSTNHITFFMQHHFCVEGFNIHKGNRFKEYEYVELIPLKCKQSN